MATTEQARPQADQAQLVLSADRCIVAFDDGAGMLGPTDWLMDRSIETVLEPIDEGLDLATTEVESSLAFQARPCHPQAKADPVHARLAPLVGETDRWILHVQAGSLAHTSPGDRARSVLAATLDATADGLLVVDLDGQVLAYNERFIELWSIPDDLIEAGDDDAMLAYAAQQVEDGEAFRARVEEIYDAPATTSFDTIRLEGGRVFERVSKPQRLDGETVGRVWSFRDVTHHKRVQDRLRRSEEELRDLFDNLPIGLYRTTPDGRVLMVNQALVEMLGYDHAEPLLTRNLEEEGALFEPDYSREVFRQRLREEGEIRGLEARWTRPDGTKLHVRESARAVRGPDGEVRYYEGTVEDVTDRIEAEAQLAASQRRLATVLSEAPVLLASLGPEGTIELIEGSGLDAVGIDPASLRGRDVHDVPMLNQETLEAIDEALEGRPARSLVQMEDRWLEAQLVPMQEEGEITGVIGVLVDITERKSAEDQLRESRQFLQMVVSNAPVILSTLSPEGTITFVTGSALDTLELDPERLIGENAFDVFPENPAHRSNLEAALEGEPTTDTIPVDDQWLQIKSMPVFDENGELESVVRVGMDVTARVQAEAEARRLNETLEQRVSERTAELEAANRELKAFSYSISHDLRGPLQTIDGFSQILLEDHAGALGDQAEHLLERVRQASQTMDRRIDALLSMSRVTHKALDQQPTDLTGIAERILDDLARQAPDRDVDLQVQPGLTARADPELVEALLENLLRNAWKFTREEATARIEVGEETEGDQTVFYVRDNGVGIDPEKAETLFEPFHRSDDESFEGTGIGLATVDRIVRRHGGTLEATGQPGEGATFRFTLPGG